MTWNKSSNITPCVSFSTKLQLTFSCHCCTNEYKRPSYIRKKSGVGNARPRFLPESLEWIFYVKCFDTHRQVKPANIWAEGSKASLDSILSAFMHLDVSDLLRTALGGGGGPNYGVSRVNPLGNLNGSFALYHFSSHQRLSTVSSTFNLLIA
jgi:hypothetical protein